MAGAANAIAAEKNVKLSKNFGDLFSLSEFWKIFTKKLKIVVRSSFDNMDTRRTDTQHNDTQNNNKDGYKRYSAC